jgi:uncharacterized protein YndB with AHSA1/START domain
MAPTTPTLELEIPTDRPVIRFRRFVKAPPELVWDVYTKCEHLGNWWGPAALTMEICDVDLRPGGAWRHVVRDPAGGEHGFHGEYRVVDAPRRLSATFVYEGAPDHEAVDTVTFEPHDGGTLIAGESVHDSIASRDAHVASGMESGMRESYDRLGVLLARLQG